MIPFDTLTAFFASALILCLAPGPDNLFVLTQSALHGRLAGLCVTLGLCTGLIGHTFAVTLGIAALLQTSATAFTALKLCGAAYLLYLAWQAWHHSAASADAPPVVRQSFGTLYRRGIVMNLTNPKVSLFFLALLPQFAAPERGPVGPQLLLLGALFIAATILVFGSVALLAGRLGNWLRRSPRARPLMHRIAGTVFAALALKLAITER